MTAASPSSASRCLVATGDLMGWSRLAGVVRHAGLTPQQVRGADGITAADGADVAAVIVDLSDPHGGVTAVATAAGLGAKPLVIAIGPHVERDLLAAARAAGADDVLPHSATGPPLVERLQKRVPGAGQARPE